MRLAAITTIIFLAVFTPLTGCRSSNSPKVIYEEGEPDAASQQAQITPADMAKLRAWQPGSTAGNSVWGLQAL